MYEIDRTHTDIHTDTAPLHETRFVSGKVVYVESLLDGRWVGQYRSASGRLPFPYEGWTEDAFRIEVDGKPIRAGWQWRSARELAPTDVGARHFVVSLANPTSALEIDLHTLIDGTPVLTRWIEITNPSDRPIALTGLYPWCGRLWPLSDASLLPPDGLSHAVTLGFFTQWEQCREGWFEWKPLAAGRTAITSDKGQAHDAPFFILRNEPRGEYFICQLAWSANWSMEFTCELEPPRTGVVFAIGPASKDALRIIEPGERVKTPAVHLGHVEGGFDETVQAMHVHLRRQCCRSSTRSVRTGSSMRLAATRATWPAATAIPQAGTKRGF